jgi:hypothetical protein
MAAGELLLSDGSHHFALLASSPEESLKWREEFRFGKGRVRPAFFGSGFAIGGRSHFLWQDHGSIHGGPRYDVEGAWFHLNAFGCFVMRLNRLFCRCRRADNAGAGADGKYEGLPSGQSGLSAIHRSMFVLHGCRWKGGMFDAADRLRETGVSMHASAGKIGGAVRHLQSMPTIPYLSSTWETYHES